jgi:hypothetical protein
VPFAVGAVRRWCRSPLVPIAGGADRRWCRSPVVPIAGGAERLGANGNREKSDCERLEVRKRVTRMRKRDWARERERNRMRPRARGILPLVLTVSFIECSQQVGNGHFNWFNRIENECATPGCAFFSPGYFFFKLTYFECVITASPTSYIYYYLYLTSVIS